MHFHQFKDIELMKGLEYKEPKIKLNLKNLSSGSII